jgi:hypothetical protein
VKAFCVNVQTLNTNSFTNFFSKGETTMKEWTIMVYMAGDNNLSEDMITSINDLDAGVSSAITMTTSSMGQMPTVADKISFFVEFDCSHPTAPTRRYLFGGDGVKPANTTSGDMPPQPIKTFIDDTSNSNAVAIGNFVKDGIRNYPANRYALIISGHSDAFQGRTLLLDENPSGATTLREISCELKKALGATKLEILGFDSCVMNTLEVIYEFRELTNYWLGSQGSIPNYTWDYRGIGLSLVQKSDKFDAKEIIKVFVEKNRDFNHKYSFGGRAIDISGFSMDFFKPEFIPTLENFAETLFSSLLLPCFEMLLDQSKKQEDRDDKLDFSRFPILRMLVLTHWKCQTFMHEQSVDLRDFCECLMEACNQTIRETESFAVSAKNISDEANFLILNLRVIYNQADAVIGKLNASYTKGATIGADYRFSNGVSLFLPWSFLAYTMSVKHYEELKFVSDTTAGRRWNHFIRLFSILTQRPRPDISPDALSEILENLKILINLQTFEVNEKSDKSVSKLIEIEGIDKLSKILFSASGGFRDDPKRTRGLDDDYSFYFKRMKNIRTTPLDLESERDFEKP